MSLADKIFKENYVKIPKDNIHLSTSNLVISSPKPRTSSSHTSTTPQLKLGSKVSVRSATGSISARESSSRSKALAKQDALNFPVFVNPPPPKAPPPPRVPPPPKSSTSTSSKRVNVGDTLQNVKDYITSDLKSVNENLTAKIDIIHKQLHILVEKSNKIANTPVQFSNTIKDVYDSKYQIIIQGLQSKCRALMEESKNRGTMPIHHEEELRLKQELIDTLSNKIEDQEIQILEKNVEIEKLKLQLNGSKLP